MSFAEWNLHELYDLLSFELWVLMQVSLFHEYF